MKKIFLALFILASTLIFSTSVSAVGGVGPPPPGYVSPTVAPSTIPNNLYNLTFPGFNCGYADDPLKNKCCRVNYPTSFETPDVGPMNIVAKTLNFLGNSVIDKIWTPFTDIFKGISRGSISSCYTGYQSKDDSSDPDCRCINPITPSPSYLGAMNDFCQRQSNEKDRIACLTCANDGGIFSGIGCVKTDAKKFIQETVFGLGIGLAGGFSLLCIIYAAFMMQSSQGNPEKLKKAQEMITSCIMGLMLIIFSVFILKLIGVNILKIEGFGN